MHLAIDHLVDEMHVDLRSEALLGVFLDACEDAHGIGLQLMDGHGVRRVERQRDHSLLLRQVDADHHVVVGHVARLQLAVVVGALVYVVVVLHLVVGHPDAAQAGGLGGHDVDAVTEVDGQLLDAGAGKLEHLVLHHTALEGGLHKRDGHVVRTHTLLGLALEPYEHHLGCVDVPGVAQQLLHQFAAAFAHAHVAERSIASV